MVLKAAFSLALGLASWALGQLVESLSWLPYVALPVSVVFALLVSAQLFFDHRRREARVGLPGFGVHMAIRISDIQEPRRQYVFDWGEPKGQGASFYLSASRRFVFSVRDKRGESYNLEVPAGWLGFPIADFSYFGLEAGTDGVRTVMRAILNGRVIGERTLPFPLEFEKREVNSLTFGSNHQKTEHGGFGLNNMCLVSQTLTSAEAKQMQGFMAERTGAR